MTKANVTQAEIYTPEEANAFNEGHEDAVIGRFDGKATLAEGRDFTKAETDAYAAGFHAGQASFGGIVYGGTDCPSCQGIAAQLVRA
jgi:hypothetical protein